MQAPTAPAIILQPIPYGLTPLRERTTDVLEPYLLSLGFDLQNLRAELRQLCSTGGEFRFDLKTDGRTVQYKDDLAIYLPRALRAGRISTPERFDSRDVKMGGALFWWVMQWRSAMKRRQLIPLPLQQVPQREVAAQQQQQESRRLEEEERNTWGAIVGSGATV